ncbi:hypothetical protein [Sphingomonas lenta]|uniref:Uncharacterized protein n=1 Tax=Sphingomonas lenta TaxID=1141887 RepID=A0A2A2SJK4_9SPHN|nr:hypothetical protein [Sphingomonas lenta]PAX09422.1 hypothetical protein CKY28_01315 [Sphingomonas lenta]
MSLKLISSSVAALALAAAPVAAAANPAASLSLSQIRTASATSGDSELSAPGAAIGLILSALVIAGGIYLVVDDEDEDEPDSP